MLVDNGGPIGTNTPVNAFGTFNLTIRNGGVVHPSDGYLVLSNLLVDTGGWLTSIAGQTNLSVAILSNAVVATGGLVGVDAQGFAQATGPGAGSSVSGLGAGAGYGGFGGDSATAGGGVPYGSATQPVDRGSGGGLGSGPLSGGSQGGGAIRLNVGGTLTIDGAISAEGNAGVQDNSGGGSGGSIWVTAGTLAGNGSIAADGGPGELYGGSGGSGGRIALYRHSAGRHTTNFSGTISAYGGDGYSWGDDGTVLVGSDFTLPQVLSQTPVGLVSNAVSSVDLTFSTAVNPYSFDSTAILLNTPNGLADSNSITVSMLSPTLYRVYFPQQTALGAYTITVGPQIEDLYGQPMSQAYTGAFAISLPFIQGQVTDTNGLPVAGVVLQPDGGMSPAATDSHGNYMLGFVPGSSFTVTPSMAGLMFAPGSMSYPGVTTTVSNQNYLAVGSIGPAVGATLQAPNLALGWHGLLGVHYQVYSSTNLVDWLPYGDVIAGSNAAVQVLVPIDSDPLRFFRILAGN